MATGSPGRGGPSSAGGGSAATPNSITADTATPAAEPVAAGLAAAPEGVVSVMSNALRGRSQSPGQYASRGYGRPLSSARGAVKASPLSAWPEGAMSAQSPRTPRQNPGGAAEYRVNAVIAELQRQAEAERRSVQRQLEHLERRQEQLAAPAAGRERWADLQGSVSGMLEEMSALSRRVEGLDEKLRAKIGTCEELVRQKTRELEQQLHTQQQKAALAVSTSEELSKRNTARMRKVSQTVEEHARRLSALDEQQRNRFGSSDAMQIEVRLCELQQQQASLEEEFRNLLMATENTSASLALFNGDASMRSADGLGSTSRSTRDLALAACDADVGASSDRAALRALERDFSRLSQTLDEHAASLANLRVRSDGQEQRLSVTYERLENVVSTPLEAFRAEVLQLRDRDRQETESQVHSVTQRLQALADQSEEGITEMRDSLDKLASDLRAVASSADPRCSMEDLGGGGAAGQIRRLAEQQLAQEDGLRRLEAYLAETHKGVGPLLAEDLDFVVRIESLEHRTLCLEQANPGDELEQKADRTEVLRLDAALQELSEPLRRLSQRTAGSEAKTTALERQIERLRQAQESLQQRVAAPEGFGGAVGQGRSVSPAPVRAPTADADELAASVSAANSRAEAVAQELSILRARLLEVESQLETVSEAATQSGPPASLAGDSGGGGVVALERIAKQEKFCGELSTRLESVSERIHEQEEALLRLAQKQQEPAVSTRAGSAADADGAVDEALALLEREKASIAEIRGQVEEQLQDILRRQKDVAAEMGSDLQSQLDELRKRHEALNISFNTQEVASEQFQTQVQQQLEFLRKGQEDIAAGAGGEGGVDEQRITEILDRIDDDRRASDTLHEGAQKQLDDLKAKLEEVAQSSGGGGSPLTDLAAQLQESGEVADDAAAKASKALEKAAVVEEALSKLESQCGSFQTKAEDLAERITAFERSTADDLAALQDSAKRAADFEGRATEELKSIQESTEAGKELQKQLRSQIELLEQQQQQQVKPAAGGDADDAKNAAEEAERRASALVEERCAKLHERLRAGDERSGRIEASLEDALEQLKESGAAHEELGGDLKAKLQEMDAALKKQLQERLQELDAKLQQELTEVREAMPDDAGGEKNVGGPELAEMLDRVVNIEAQLAKTSRKVEDLQEQVRDAASKEPEASPDRADAAAIAEREKRVNDAIKALEAGEAAAGELQEEVRRELEELRKQVRAVAERGSAVAGAPAAAVAGASSSEVDEKVGELRRALEADFSERIAAVQAEVGKPKADNGEDTAEEAMRRITGLTQRLTKAEKGTADLEKDVERTTKRIEDRLDKLRIDHDLLVKQQGSAGGGGSAQEGSEGLSAKAAKALEKALSSEEALEEIQAALKDGRTRQQELSEQIKSAIERVEASEAATTAVREELMSAVPASPAAASIGAAGTCSAATGEAAKALEAKVRALMEEVSKETDALKEHHQELRSGARSLGSGAAAGGGAAGVASSAVEKEVKELSRQMEEELVQLRAHQKQIVDTKQRLLSSTPPSGGAGLNEVNRVEKRVADLAASFADELKALEEQQADTRKAKLTLQDLSGQVQELRTLVEGALRKKKSGGSGGRGGQTAANGKPRTKGGSDESESYSGDDFEDGSG